MEEISEVWRGRDLTFEQKGPGPAFPHCACSWGDAMNFLQTG